jgi:hypothetical protein
VRKAGIIATACSDSDLRMKIVKMRGDSRWEIAKLEIWERREIVKTDAERR